MKNPRAYNGAGLEKTKWSPNTIPAMANETCSTVIQRWVLVGLRDAAKARNARVPGTHGREGTARRPEFGMPDMSPGRLYRGLRGQEEYPQPLTGKQAREMRRVSQGIGALNRPCVGRQ